MPKNKPQSYESIERLYNEQDLKEIESYIADFWLFLPIPVCYLNPVHIILNVDKEFEFFSGYRAEEIVGEHVDKLFAHPVEIEKIKEDILKKKVVTNLKIHFLSKDKKQIPVTVYGMARIDENDDFIGYFLSLMDITETEMYEEQLRSETAKLVESYRKLNKAHRQLKELDKLKDDFISSVSHELKSPLSAIEGYVELLLEKVKSDNMKGEEQYKKALKIILDNTERLGNFIENVLDLTMINTGKLKMDKKQIDMVKLCDEVIALYLPLAKKQNILLKKEIKGIQPIYALGDEEKITQIMGNLVSNAIKFTPQGEVKIVLRKNDKDVHVSVIDTGIGIPKDKLNKIFDKFERIKIGWEKLRGKVKGTGLGLTIIKGLIQAHGGEIWVESRINKGSQFHFTLPVMSSQGKRKRRSHARKTKNISGG